MRSQTSRTAPHPPRFFVTKWTWGRTSETASAGAAAKGSVILVKVEGEDEVDAMNVLGELIQDGFGEE